MAADMQDMEPDACVPETVQESCNRRGALCGMLTIENNCGTQVTVNCGGCEAPLECGLAGSPNVCSCEGSDDPAICAREDAECGTIVAMDPACGVERSVNCGGCTEPESCGGGGLENQCGCTPETQEAFCLRIGATCGMASGVDRCGIPRTYPCGECSGPVLSCGGGGVDNRCGCDEATICNQLGLECGSVDVSNDCPNLIAAVDCGGCGQGACNPDNTCACNNGYENVNGTCVDINECNSNNGGCDANATCTNTPGSFSCACNAGFSGNGTTCTPNAPMITHTVQTNMTAGTVMTTPAIPGSTTITLYVAFVSVRTDNRFVEEVTGLNLQWSRQARQCNRNGTEHLDVWVARGMATAGGVTLKTLLPPDAAAATVMRITGDAVLETIARNQNGDGNCNGGGPWEMGYTYPANQVAPNNLMLAATSTFGATHNAGTGWMEHTNSQATAASNVTSHYVMYRTTTGSNPFAVAGDFVGMSPRWASINLTIQGP